MLVSMSSTRPTARKIQSRINLVGLDDCKPITTTRTHQQRSGGTAIKQSDANLFRCAIIYYPEQTNAGPIDTEGFEDC